MHLCTTALVQFSPKARFASWVGPASLTFLFAVPLVQGAIQVFRYPRGFSLSLGRAVGGSVLASLGTLALTSVLALEGMICVAMAAPIFLSMTLLGSGFRLAHGGGSIERPPALPGEHAQEVLEEAGYGEEEIAALRRDGVI